MKEYKISQGISNILRIGFILIFAILLWKFLPKLKIDNSVDGWIPGDSEEIINYQEFVNGFGSDGMIILSINSAGKRGGKSDEEIAKEIDPYIGKIGSIEIVQQITPWPVSFMEMKIEPSDSIFTYLISYDPASLTDPLQPDLLDQMDAILTQQPYAYHLAGTGVFYREMNQQTEKSIQRHLASGLILLLLTLVYLLRSPKAIAMVLMVSIGGVLTMLLIASIMNVSIGLLHVVLPLIILFYGTSAGLHILFHGGNHKKVWIPTLMAGITTSIGFSMFLLDDIPLMQDFSLLSVSGILGGFLWATVLFYPHTIQHQPRESFTKYFGNFPQLKERYVWFILGLFLIISIPGMNRLKADVYSLDGVPPDAKAVQDHFFIDKNVGSYLPIECMVDRKKARLPIVKNWVKEAMKIEEIGGVMSYYQLPPFFDAREAGFRSRVNKDLFRITFLVKLIPNSKGQEVVSSLKSLAANSFEDYEPIITGYIPLYLYGSLTEKLGHSFSQSLLWAFGFIFLIIGLFLRNIWLAIAALFANGLPILFIIGMMGWLGLNLDMITVPIGCLLLGIVVDDTIHFLYWYRKSNDSSEAIMQAGPGIFYTSFLLMVGFIIMAFSPAPPVMYYGILSFSALLGALFSDLFLLPALIHKMKKWRLL